MKSSFRIASLALVAFATLLLGACASTTEAGVTAEASTPVADASVSGSASTSTTTSEATTEDTSEGGTP